MTSHRSVQRQEQVHQFNVANHNISTPGRSAAGPLGHLSMTVVLLGSLLLSLSVWAQTAPPPPPTANTQINSPEPLKLPVAHAHFGSWCMGYLTITPQEVRYDAVRSHGKDEHSFSVTREQVLFLNYWLLAGQPMNAVEIRTATKNYHFWLMQSAEELQLTHSSWRPVQAAASDTLLLSLYYWKVTGNVPNLMAVNQALVAARAQAATAAMAQANAAGAPGTNNGDAWQKMNDHMFVNDYSSKVTTSTINSINHMSHW